jgi:8-amino-7-oxononanoate synthase
MRSNLAVSPYYWLEKSLDTIHRANWYRELKTIQGISGAIANLEGDFVVNLASNDYLGLAGDSRLIRAAVKATQELGTGSTGSRLLTGHRQLHRDLEKAIASLKQTEDAIVFSSGYLANLGTITALVGQKDLIISDQYNHSSLKNGAKLSGAKVIEYFHRNDHDLALKLHQNRSQYRRCLIITDTVFSMDGDLAHLPKILELATNFESMVLVDEAHATGVMGQTGAGAVEHLNCTGQPLIQMGTLSKALGSLGGYVAGSAVLVDFLRNRAPSWVYTTALSPADTAAALEAIKVIKTEPKRRENLGKNVELMKKGLADFTLLESESPILCISLANPSQALELSDRLLKKGFFVPAIRPPTVPTSRLRITVMATHTSEQIHQFLNVFKEVMLDIGSNS